jgi:hypothetical protein
LDPGLHVVDGGRGTGHDDDLLQGVEVADHDPLEVEAPRVQADDLRCRMIMINACLIELRRMV